MSAVEVDLSQLGELQTRLAGAANHVTAGMPKILDEVADAIVERAKSLAPVDQGELREAIRILERKGNALIRERRIGADVRQALFQEFGTSAHPPQPWLRPAADAGLSKLGDELGKLGAPW
jgi:HK97 gp10 family phage protein